MGRCPHLRLGHLLQVAGVEVKLFVVRNLERVGLKNGALELGVVNFLSFQKGDQNGSKVLWGGHLAKLAGDNFL